jgi:hypothetical protein
VPERHASQCGDVAHAGSAAAETPARGTTVRARLDGGRVAKLSRCRFRLGGFAELWVRALSDMPDEAELSPRQAEVLDELTHEYREQLANRQGR